MIQRVASQTALCVLHLIRGKKEQAGQPCLKGETHAKRTARPKAPGGRDRQRCSHCEDRNGRDRRNNIEATGQAQERFGGSESTSREHHRSPARGNRAQGCKSEVGVMACPSTVVAREILDLSRSSGRPLTPLELIKLTYLAHGWSLAFRGEPLVSEAAQAWQYGPVFPELYHSLKSFRANPVSHVPHSVAEAGAGCELDPVEKSLIQSVYEAYKSFNGVQLSSLTHQPNTPWDQAWRQGRNSTISNDVIKAHFLDLKQQRAS